MENQLIDGSFSHQGSQGLKSKKFIKILGWITFGFSLWYIVSCSLEFNKILNEQQKYSGVFFRDQSLFSYSLGKELLVRYLLEISGIVLAFIMLINSLKLISFKKSGYRYLFLGYCFSILYFTFHLILLFLLDNRRLYMGVRGDTLDLLSFMIDLASILLKFPFFIFIIVQLKKERVKSLFK